MLSPFAAIVLGTVPLLLAFLYRRLRYIRFERLAGMPHMKTSWVWGDALNMNEMAKGNPPDGHYNITFWKIWHKLNRPSFYTIEVWPFQRTPTVVICDHEMAEQMSKTYKTFPYSIPKADSKMFHSLLGSQSMFLAEGEVWKTLRKRFNPGFAPQHLMTLLPVIVEKTSIFMDRLDHAVETGDELSLDDYLTELTFDIIGAVVMNVEIGAQLGEDHQSEILTIFRKMVQTFHSTSGGLFPMSPITRYKQSRLARRLDGLLKNIVRQKYLEGQQMHDQGAQTRSVLALSLQDQERLDDAVVYSTCDQLKTFLLAGHDTTSIMMQWLFYELSRTPRALKAVRAEVDGIFGLDTSPEAVKKQLFSPGGADMIRQMPYTAAVIKEVLRLHPPAAGARTPPYGSGIRVTDPATGIQHNWDGMGVVLDHAIIQRDPKVYGETADEFYPERWLNDSEIATLVGDVVFSEAQKKDRKEIPPSAFRVFERGPRTCIGQELVSIEGRVIVACVVRRYDFVKVGLGSLEQDRAGNHILNEHGCYKIKEPLYETYAITARPCDGMRVKVKLSEKAMQDTQAVKE